MSETSDSLQVRTDDAERCVEQLRGLGFNGFVFQGSQGWLTVVPYGGPEGMNLQGGALERFAHSLAAPVLNYLNNDYGWGFTLALPDGQTTEFFKFVEDPAQFGIFPEPLNESVLSAVSSLAQVRRFFQPGPPADGDEGHLFGKAMGFPQTEWLSPFYVTDAPAEARSRGGQEIGHRPQSMPGHASP